MKQCESVGSFALACVAAQQDMDDVYQALASSQNVTEEWARFFVGRVALGKNDCLLWTSYIDELGYGRVAYKRKQSKSHRVSWILMHGRIPEGLKVRHTCDVRNCINPNHLRLGTQAENIADMMERGRHRSIPMIGENNPASKLDEKTVRDIRLCVANGESQGCVSRRLGLRPMHVSQIVRRQLWTHI